MSNSEKIGFDLFHEVDKLTKLLKVSNFISSNLFQGEHLSTNKGNSYDFEGYSEYTPGKDTRKIDWNLWSRTEKIFVKEFFQESNINTNLILDCSSSMQTFFSENNKWNSVIKLIAGLSYIFINCKEKVALTLLKEKVSFLPFKNSKEHFFNIISHLEKSTKESYQGSIDFELNKSINLTEGKKNIAILFSDFFDNNKGILKTLKKIKLSGNKVIFIHTMSGIEKDFSLKKKGYLIEDAESQEKLDVSISNSLIKEYQSITDKYLKDVKKNVESLGLSYLFINTDDNILLNIKKIISTLKK